VLRAIEVGWLGREELVELLAGLRRGEGRGVEELLLEPLENEVVVRFLGEEYRCRMVDLTQLMDYTLRASTEHPGCIEYYEGDRLVSRRAVLEVPEGARFANTAKGPVPIVKVVARDMDPTSREVTEHGPRGEILRSTVLRRT